MFISQETAAETEARLRQVITQASLRIFEGQYAFREYPADAFPTGLLSEALAFVRDEQVWSALVPCTDLSAERFSVFSFHFAPGLDNSGFVGWLASHLKITLGTGVFVVCGQNRHRGGVFDYWGVPMALKQAALEEVRRLRGDPTAIMVAPSAAACQMPPPLHPSS